MRPLLQVALDSHSLLLDDIIIIATANTPSALLVQVNKCSCCVLFMPKNKKEDPCTRPERDLKHAGLGSILVSKYVVFAPDRSVSFKPGSGSVPSKLGPALLLGLTWLFSF